MSRAAPLISIITPAYNAAATLGATIESVQKQSFTDWEMIIIDDCSLDGTMSLAERYALADDRIRMIRRAESAGFTQARNVGLGAAAGRYVAFLDAGDLWLPEKLQRQLNFMQEQNAAMSCTAYRRFTDPANPRRVLRCPKHVTFDTLLRKTCAGTLTMMVDRQQTGPIAFNEDLHGNPDLALWLNLTKTGYDIAFLNQDLARHRMTSETHFLRSAWATWRIYRDVAGLTRKQAFLALLSYAFNALLKRIF